LMNVEAGTDPSFLRTSRSVCVTWKTAILGF
jgi:hypothetical protein